MKIQSQYYDVYDYLQQFDDERTFLRKESTVFCEVADWNKNPMEFKFWKDTDKRPMVQQLNSRFHCTPNVFENPNLHDEIRKEWEELSRFGHPAEFIFFPTNLRIPIKVYLKNHPDNIIIKEYNKDNKHRSVGGEIIGQENEFFKQFNEFIKQSYQSFIWKCSVKPVCCIIMRNWNGKQSNFNHNVIWINPPLVMIPNLFNYFDSYEQVYQEIEQFLWNDVEMKDPMINITNDDRIVGHGFDLKSSFRKEKKNA